MTLLWNLDLPTRNCIFLCLILLYFDEWVWLSIFMGMTYFWSELDEDDIGDDLEEYIEFFLDEFGFHDRWSNDVIENLEQYGDLVEHYNTNYSFRYSSVKNAFAKTKEETLSEPIDHELYREQRERYDLEVEYIVKNYMWEESQRKAAEDGNVKKKSMDEKKIKKEFENLEHPKPKTYKAQNENDFSSSKYSFDDIDPDFVDYSYLYKIAEKYYTWNHTSNYPRDNDTIIDWEELWLEKLNEKYDLKKKGNLYNDDFKMMSSFIKNKNNLINSEIKTYTIDVKKELSSHPYPIFAKKDSQYYLIYKSHDRWRNGMDFHLIKNLLIHTNQKKLDELLSYQQYVKNHIKSKRKKSL